MFALCIIGMYKYCNDVVGGPVENSSQTLSVSAFNSIFLNAFCFCSQLIHFHISDDEQVRVETSSIPSPLPPTTPAQTPPAQNDHLD